MLEFEAESCAYSVLSFYGVDTGANSFGYIAEFARPRELKELKASLDTIRKTTAEIIGGIDENYRALAKERGIDLSVVTDELGAEQNYNMAHSVTNNEPPKDAESAKNTEPPKDTAPSKETEPPRAEEKPAQTESEQAAAPSVLTEYERHAAVRAPRQAGVTVLMPLLFEDGNLNRDNKRSRVKVEPPIGKYELFSRDEGTPPHTTNYLYAMTASGRLALLGETERLKDLTEARLDGHIRLLAESFEKQLANPAEWADFAAAAFLNRIDEAEAHNIPVRELREAESQARHDAVREHEKQVAAEKQEIFDARVDEIAKAIERGENVKVGYDARENGGKNPVLELFRLYGVDLPLRTQGWVNTTLAAITPEGYSRYTKIGGKKRGESERFGERLLKLKQAVKHTPIEQKRGIAGDEPEQNTEVKRTLEHDLYQKFAEMFPYFMNRKYSNLQLKAEYAKPLELEWVFGDTLSVAHTYELNGNPAYEPLVTLKADSVNKTLTASSLELSEPPRNDAVYNGDGRPDAAVRENINNFMSQWLDRIEKQGFMPVRATLWNEGKIDDAGIIVAFDKDGNVAAEEDIAESGGEIQETLDAFAAKHGFGKLTAEFYSDTFTKKEPQSVIIREGAERHELLRRNLFEFSKGEKMSAAHLSAYFSRLETMKAYVARGHDDMTLYDIDVIKARRDYKVRERQTKMGRDTDLPLPAAKNCGIGDIVLIYDPNKIKCSYMKVEELNKKNVVLSDIASSFVKVKLSAERFRKEQGYNLIESPAVNKQTEQAVQSPAGTKEFWRKNIADFLAASGGKMDIGDFELSPFNNAGGLGRFYEVFGENTYLKDFAHIVAEENTRRTGEPWVVFNFCEGGAYRPDILQNPSALSFTEADSFIKGYEPAVRRELRGKGYDKLDYTVYIKREGGDAVPLIDDHYDLGDRKPVDGLFNEIKSGAEYYYAHPETFGWTEATEGFTQEKARTFADLAMLEKFAASAEKQEIFTDKDGGEHTVYHNGNGKAFEIGMGHLGNGLTVWNRLEERDGDYVTVAHISRDREVKFYEKDLPQAVKDLIDREARTCDISVSVTQDTPVFNKPPQPETPKQTAIDLSLPDPTVTAAAMNGYGYTEPDMYPLSGDRALELFDTGHTIYLLYDDNTETMAFDRDEIITFSSDGLLGITKTDWEMSPVRDAQNKVYEDAISNREQSENSRESDLLCGDNPYYRENKYGIYQIKDDLPEARDFRSAPLKELEAHSLSVNRDNYTLVYTADLPGRVEFLRDKTTALNNLFEKFNIDHPADYTGRSMSVGDVVVLRCNGDITAHFVDSVGFVELSSFTGDERKTPTEQAFSQVGKSPTVAEPEADVESGKSISLLELASATNAERKSGARNIIDSIPRDERPQKPAEKGKPSILADLDEFRKIAGSGGKQDNYRKTERGYE
jgi:hypothetical protein